MNQVCRLCGQHEAGLFRSESYAITNGICDSCLSQITDADGAKGLLEAIEAPVLLMRGNPRQVITANAKALDLFDKTLPAVEAHRGGEVFDCVHSFTAAGCGLDANCENCKIKHAIVDTFVTATPHCAVSTVLQIMKTGSLEPRTLQVSTERLGDLALVRIERFESD
jgi:hypothetical protein